MEEGALVMIPLTRPYPFGIARVISADEDGRLELQWQGNTTDNPTGTYMPGWTTYSGSRIYYADKPKHRDHQKFLVSADNSDIQLSQYDVLIHGFELTGTKHLPAPLLRAIAAHPNVWWKPSDS